MDLFALVVLPFVLLAMVLRWTAQRKRIALWRSVLESQHVTNIAVGENTMSGVVGRLNVQLELHRPDDAEDAIRLSLRSPYIHGTLGLRTRTRDASTWSRPEGADNRSGDAAFDVAFRATGPADLLHARLNTGARLLLLRLHASGPVELHAGALTVTIPERSGAPILARVLAELLEAGRALSVGGSDVELLAANAMGDPQYVVRLRSLMALLQDFPSHPATRSAIEAGCIDPHPAVRLRAALSIQPARFDIALAIVDGPSTDNTTVAIAIDELGPRLPVDRAQAALERALRDRAFLIAHACLERLATSGDPDVVTTLANVLANETGELAVHAARALAETRLASAEAPLVAALDGGLDVRTATAAAQALGRCGTVDAVLPLQQAVARYEEKAFVQAAREAIAAIQSRLSGVDRGELSIADGDTGQLSFPAQEGGEVSLADPVTKGEDRQP